MQENLVLFSQDAQEHLTWRNGRKGWLHSVKTVAADPMWLTNLGVYTWIGAMDS